MKASSVSSDCLEDVDGNGAVENADKLAIQAAIGSTNPNLDVNGDGAVSARDSLLMQRSIGRRLMTGLLWDD